MALREDDVGLHDLAAQSVRPADHRGLRHRRVLEQRALHLERADPVARRGDDVVRPAHEPEVAVLVPRGGVAGVVPAVPEGPPIGLGRVDVPVEQPGGAGRRAVRPHRDVADLARSEPGTVVVHHVHVEARHGLAHGAGADGQGRIVREEADRLGLAVAVVDGVSGRLLPDPDDLRVERLAGPERAAEGAEVVPAEVHLREHPVDGGRGAERGHPEPGDEPQVEVGVEAVGVVEDDRGPHLPGGEEEPPRRLGPPGVRERPVDVLLAEVHPVAAGQEMGEGVAVVARDHLREGGRAGGEVDEQRLVGAGRAVGREGVRGRAHRLVERRPAGPRRGAGRRSGHDDEPFEGRTGGADRVHLGGVVVGHDREAGLGRVDPVLDVPRGEQVGRGHRDDPGLRAPDEHVVPGRNPRDHHEGEVPALRSELAKDVRDPVRGAGEVAEREPGDGLAGRVDRDAGGLVGALRPAVDEVEPEVVALRGLEPHLPARALVVRHVRQAHGAAPCFVRPSGACPAPAARVRGWFGPRPASI